MAEQFARSYRFEGHALIYDARLVAKNPHLVPEFLAPPELPDVEEDTDG